MRRQLAVPACLVFLLFCSSLVSAQENVTIVAPSSEVAEELDLKAVSELFKESENLEEFEKALNDPDVGVNNLDLDENGEVDFIRVVEEVADETHVIILQVQLAEDEFQDVATIEVEKVGEDEYNMQIRGNEEFYGANYYVVPTTVHIHTWPVIRWMYRPFYTPYRSVFRIGFRPVWWKPYQPVKVHVYRTRTVTFTKRASFNVAKTSRVKTVHKVNYRPHSSTQVKVKTKTVRTRDGVKKTTKTTVRKKRK